jgi:integrase
MTKMATNTEIIDISSNRDLTTPINNVKSDIPSYWSRDQIHLMLDSVHNALHKMLFTFLWMTGVRITEAIELRRRDFDFDGYLITIRWQKNRKYESRNIPLHPQLRQLLQLYCSNMKYDDFLFNLSRQRAWQLSQKYFDANPHKFRHSFAVNWLKCGGSIVVLSQIMGHSDVKVTMGYLRIVPVEQGKELIKITF